MEGVAGFESTCPLRLNWVQELWLSESDQQEYGQKVTEKQKQKTEPIPFSCKQQMSMLSVIWLFFLTFFFPCCHWGKSRSQSRKQAFQIYTLTAKTQIGFTRGGHLAVGYVFLTVINSSAECISSSLTSTGKKNTKWKLGIKAARRGPINLEFLTTTVGPEFIGNIAQLKPRRVLATFGFGVCRSVACRGAPTTFHILRKEIVSEVVRWASFDQQSSTGRLGTVSL